MTTSIVVMQLLPPKLLDFLKIVSEIELNKSTRMFSLLVSHYKKRRSVIALDVASEVH